MEICMCIVSEDDAEDLELWKWEYNDQVVDVGGVDAALRVDGKDERDPGARADVLEACGGWESYGRHDGVDDLDAGVLREEGEEEATMVIAVLPVTVVMARLYLLVETPRET